MKKKGTQKKTKFLIENENKKHMRHIYIKNINKKATTTLLNTRQDRVKLI